MTINITELRRLAQAATPHVGHACKYQDAHWLREGHVDFENADLFIASERPQEDAAFYAAANPTTINKLLDRLESAEADALEQARLNGMGASREAALMAKLEAAENEVAHIKEVEFPRKVRAVAAGWETKCARLEQDRDELLARIEAAEELVRELQRNLSSGMWRVLREENEALSAKVEAMEQQEPVAIAKWTTGGVAVHLVGDVRPGDILYLAPGAQTQGEDK